MKKNNQRQESERVAARTWEKRCERLARFGCRSSGSSTAYKLYLSLHGWSGQFKGEKSPSALSWRFRSNLIASACLMRRCALIST